MPTIKPFGTTLSKEKISSGSFGGNYLFNRATHGSNIGQSGSFDEIAAKLGVTHLRFPGGAITETMLDLSSSATYNSSDPNSVCGFLYEAAQIDAKVTVVIPTCRYINSIMSKDPASMAAAESEIRLFVSTILSGELSNVVEAFEIGNEYYALPDYSNGALAWGESESYIYGSVASKITSWVNDCIKNFGSTSQPNIFVQAGRSTQENADVLSAFGAAELAAVDGAVIHNYRWTPWDSQSTTTQKFAQLSVWDQRAGKELLRVVSEWNVGSPEGVTGLAGATGLLDMFNLHERLGVDLAHVWPLLQKTRNTLGIEGNNALAGSPELTTHGEAFRQLERLLPGLSPFDFNSRVDVDGDGEADFVVHAYGDDVSKLVLFVSSLEDYRSSIKLDLNGFGSISKSYTHAWAQVLGVRDGFVPTDPKAASRVSTLMSAQVEGSVLRDGVFDIYLNPHEIFILDISKDKGVSIYGDDQNALNDTLTGSHLNDAIFGGMGNDRGLGGAGADLMEGGLGADTLDGDAGNDTLRGGDANDELFGGADRDDLFGGNGNDTLKGGLGDDALWADIGDDFICGDDGNDLAVGMDGDDRVYGGAGNDTVVGHAGNDLLAGGTGLDVLWGDGGNDSILGDDGDDWLHGQVGDDSLEGGGGNDWVIGYDGNDVATGGLGDDTLVGHAGSDLLRGEAGRDVLWGDGDDDLIFGGTEADWLHGGIGNDYLDGGNGSDFLFGGEGADYVVGGDGDDLSVGEEGDDTVQGGNGNDIVVGQSGNDQLSGDEGHDTLWGDAGNDQFFGGNGNDWLHGQDGDDLLQGGGGTDQLIGGLGSDTLDGGAGADMFVFRSSADFGNTQTSDRITDFQAGVDRVVMTGLGLTFMGEGRFSGIIGEMRAERFSGGVTVWLDLDGDQIADAGLRIDGASGLTSTDFLF